MSIYDALRQDHDRHRDILARLAETEGASDTRRKLWREFYYEVGAHAAAEEESFYSPLMQKEDGQPMGRHSVAEHKELDDIIQELEEMDFSSSGWLTRFKTLRHRYEHHIEEEEEEVFEVARKVLGADKDGAIEKTFHKRKQRERKLVDEKAEATPDE
ncbi:MAG: hemerythrin domain-containing protein [Acidobacteria bacterium]|jgi:hemerythrin-like domain-containing protein|nr:hemerythrin domain-containing protein [Acidobacteriota bacterium]